ncbi:hypothetical protein [Demequina sp. SO4-18]|uniref:hypothetical protein n=1 Tax=Demequina sp. SO4-18 TaxID=3401026 RepID=UPI003B5A74EE
MTTDRTYTEAVSEFGERMARLEGKLDTGLAKMSGSLDTLTQAVEAGNAARAAESAELRKDVDDHEHRVRSLEKFMWKAVGLGAGGGAILGTLANWLITPPQ